MTPQPPPAMRKQFGLRALFAATVACALLFSAFRWLGVPPRASLFVSGLLAVSLLAALGLMAAIARDTRGDG